MQRLINPACQFGIMVKCHHVIGQESLSALELEPGLKGILHSVKLIYQQRKHSMSNLRKHQQVKLIQPQSRHNLATANVYAAVFKHIIFRTCQLYCPV